MYLHEIQLKNAGPIENLDIKLGTNESGTPKPLVIVGKNGSGKSIALSYIVSAMLHVRRISQISLEILDEIKYKPSNTGYIRYGEQYTYRKLIFSNGLVDRALLLSVPKYRFSGPPSGVELDLWNSIGIDQNYASNNNFSMNRELIRSKFQAPHVYFPSNRYEVPAWIDINDAMVKNHIPVVAVGNKYSDRSIIETSPLKANFDWLFNIVLEEVKVLAMRGRLFEKGDARYRTVKSESMSGKFLGAIIGLLDDMFHCGNEPFWNFGSRTHRTIGVTDNMAKIFFHDLFSLSAGQLSILNILLTILRHWDIGISESLYPPQNSDTLSGLVVIDEAELHLHAELQGDQLPKLMKYLSDVQFVVTSQSPLFVLGMERHFGKDGFALVELPHGEEISTEQFEEFGAIYENIRATQRYINDINSIVKDLPGPTLFVEGKTDLKYIEKAAEHLGKKDLLQRYEILDGEGKDNLKKIWNARKGIGKRENVMVLLFDCDANIGNGEHGNAEGTVCWRKIERLKSLVERGIENLFPKDVLQRAIDHKKEFMDIIKIDLVERGVESSTVTYKINDEEKANLCDWICENGERQDFDRFSLVFDILRECLELGGDTSTERD